MVAGHPENNNCGLTYKLRFIVLLYCQYYEFYLHPSSGCLLEINCIWKTHTKKKKNIHQVERKYGVNIYSALCWETRAHSTKHTLHGILHQARNHSSLLHPLYLWSKVLIQLSLDPQRVTFRINFIFWSGRILQSTTVKAVHIQFPNLFSNLKKKGRDNV